MMRHNNWLLQFDLSGPLPCQDIDLPLIHSQLADIGALRDTEILLTEEANYYVASYAFGG